jgi:hypothetical protein
MTAWIRTAVLAGVAAVGPSVACGGAETFSPIPPVRCKTVYYANDKLPAHPDGASLCPPGVCNYQTQQGCSSGQTCAPHVDTNAVTKVETVIPACRVAGERAKDEPCSDNPPTSAATQCGPGLVCAEKTCHRPCCGRDWSACEPGESCIHQANIVVNKVTAYTGADLCFAVGTCNVLDLEACKAEGQTCRIADPVAEVACMPPSALVAGDSCDNDKPCGAGLHCVEDASQVLSSTPDTSPMCSGTRPCTCRRLCPWGNCNNNTCSINEGVCVHFNRDPPGVGECTPNWHGAPTTVDGGVVGDAGSHFRSLGDGGP